MSTEIAWYARRGQTAGNMWLTINSRPMSCDVTVDTALHTEPCLTTAAAAAAAAVWLLWFHVTHSLTSSAALDAAAGLMQTRARQISGSAAATLLHATAGRGLAIYGGTTLDGAYRASLQELSTLHRENQMEQDNKRSTCLQLALSQRFIIMTMMMVMMSDDYSHCVKQCFSDCLSFSNDRPTAT